MILGIDTTGMDCSVAIWHEELIGVRTIEGGLRHNERLLSEIDTLLSAESIACDKLDAIAVSSGPGSFTGLRVGMATAKGLCIAWDIPFIAVPTLDGLARANEAYWTLFE